MSSTDAAVDMKENAILQKQIIESFRNSLGFSVLEEGDSTVIYSDSLLSVLENSKQYDAYFELSRIIIKSQVLKGETRMAIAHSDVMYSKAKVQNHFLGLALSLSAIGEVYAAVGRNKEAGDVYERSLEIFERHKLDEGMKKTLLVELIEYNIRMENTGATAKYLGLLSQYSTGKQSELELDILRIFNAYYKTQIWNLEVPDRSTGASAETNTRPSAVFYSCRGILSEENGEIRRSIEGIRPFFQSGTCQ